jgi:uncharacterized membrane protein HdeD (DUF308 family)
MQLKATISFVKRGLPGLLLLAAGIALGIMFNKHSAYPDEIKRLVYALALVLAVGGCSCVGSYVQQRAFKDMKRELFALGFMVATLVLINLNHS